MRAKSKRLFNVWALVLATMVVISGCGNGDRPKTPTLLIPAAARANLLRSHTPSGGRQKSFIVPGTAGSVHEGQYRY
ncbi:hypothetical protein [Paenibacillus sp. E222]|uniref:hypothetical protein n=1 Tax=Paenibacillus sp. E222 TaxID=2748863 RepID=UPI00211C3038|nr:hypothetical protein [Paenibacillus sp. E222]